MRRTTSKGDKPKQAGIWATSTSKARDQRGVKLTNHRIRQQGRQEIRAALDEIQGIDRQEWRDSIGLER